MVTVSTNISPLSSMWCPPAVPPNISELKNLEVLNMFNNQIEELPTQISSLQKLKHLNLGYVPFGLYHTLNALPHALNLQEEQGSHHASVQTLTLEPL